MLIRPRLTDFHGIHVSQSELDFAIPFLNEDIPLYVDPFLLWKSPSLQDKALHTAMVSVFNKFGKMFKDGKRSESIEALVVASECDEVGLGNSANRSGHRIGRELAARVLSLFETIPHYSKHGFVHFEEIQLLVPGIGKDRVSDIACSFLKSFLIDYTIQECIDLEIPRAPTKVQSVLNHESLQFETVEVQLPVHPDDGTPILFAPKRWLRHIPWISYEAYFRDFCPQDDIAHEGEDLDRVKVLTYNRENYGVIESFVKERERASDDCRIDPLFTQIPVVSARRKLAAIKKLPTGKDDQADRKYEDHVGELFASLLYPKLDFAQMQARTDSGVSIRDLIFYNSCTDQFLKQILEDYGSRQITMEMKNVARLNRTHVDQLNRYLHSELGNFGVFVTRAEPKKAEKRRMIDLWSGQRKAIIVISDTDVEQMVEVFESRQRAPLDIVKKKYVRFRRTCP